MTHNILLAYQRMALGLRMKVWMANEEMPYVDREEWEMLDYAWTGQELVDRICEAKNITQERFIRTMAAPKPSIIAHLIFMDELRTAFGSTANLPDQWPTGQGVIVPKKEDGEIVKIEFYRLSQMLKPRMKQAA